MYSNSERSNDCFKDSCKLWSIAFRYHWMDDFRPTLLSIITSEHILIIGSRNKILKEFKAQSLEHSILYSSGLENNEFNATKFCLIMTMKM